MTQQTRDDEMMAGDGTKPRSYDEMLRRGEPPYSHGLPHDSPATAIPLDAKYERPHHVQDEDCNAWEEDGRALEEEDIRSDSNDSLADLGTFEKSDQEVFLEANATNESQAHGNFLATAVAALPVFVQEAGIRFLQFLLPGWIKKHVDEPPELQTLAQLWLQHAHNSTVGEFLLRHFDDNGDGQISASELSLTDVMKQHFPYPETWASWFAREWPLMDWKIGVFLWRTCSGILLLLAILSIIPGRLHAVSGRILRWPVLGLTYFLVVVELMVYVVIRVAIRAAEHLVAMPKHRTLRRKMTSATSYEEWYTYAKELDESQKRDRWVNTVDDGTSGSYNWGFVQELMEDMKKAREDEDPLLALAIAHQCTRKNVGGVQAEDLYSYTNTGEPKEIVRDFHKEVVKTLHWITDDAVKLARDPRDAAVDSFDIENYEARLKRKVRSEHNRLWKSVVMAAVNMLDPEHANGQSYPPCDATVSTEASGSEASQSHDRSSLPSSFHRERVLNFLKRAQTAYGRTALCLSGGAMMGLYHFGVVRGLIENDILPHIISGTSAGSVVGAILCTRTDAELPHDLRPEVLVKYLKAFQRPWNKRMQQLCTDGNLFDFQEWLDLIQWFTRGNMTFLEAYRRTGRIFCITLSSTSKKSPPAIINYLSAPDVTIASAVIASAAVPGFIPPVQLQVKDPDGTVRRQGGENNQTFWDGSIQQDLPTQGLAEMLNCQFVVASQCNPHIVPFFFHSKGGVGRPSRWSGGTQEDSWRGGYLLSALEMYLKNDMKAKFKFLHDVEASIGFTSTLYTQDFQGSTTIVPQVRLIDYARIMRNPYEDEIRYYQQAGAVASYEHTAMIKLHYSVSRALEECIGKLESSMRQDKFRRRRTSSDRFPGDSFDAVIVGMHKQLQSEDESLAGSAPTADDNEQSDDEYEPLWNE